MSTLFCLEIIRVHMLCRFLMLYKGCGGFVESGVLQQRPKDFNVGVTDLRKYSFFWMSRRNYQNNVLRTSSLDHRLKQNFAHQKRLPGIGYCRRRSPGEPARFAPNSFVGRGYTRGERLRGANALADFPFLCNFRLLHASRYSLHEILSNGFWRPATVAKAPDATHTPHQ